MYRSATIWLVAIILVARTDKLIAENSFPITQRVENIDIKQDDGRRYRLPNDTVPETYDINLTTRIDDANFQFSGNVRIGILAKEATQLITLHHRQLTIIAVQLWTTAIPSQELTVGEFLYSPELEFLQIPIATTLTPESRYVLSINYTGTLREDNYGFYRSSYRNNDGEQIWQAVTQFESTDARHGFPCYDEPQLRAVFTTTITHGSSYSALSNMPVSDGYPIINGDGTTTTRFDPTPSMATYLNAFVISDFVSLESSSGRVPQKVYARANAINESALTLDAGIKILDAIGSYLDNYYPLPKMDQVAIPDFAVGAMENWGLVTYRESRFFYNEAVTDYASLTAIVTTIAHELGHQWFGNLIAPRWWDVIWLNEGFANLFGFIGTDEVYPEWRIMDYYVVGTLQSVFQSDALEQTRPMTNYVESPAAVSGAFDNIAYAKSGCVLRMFLNALSKQTFVKGLQKYFAAKSYLAAGEEDLFNALEEAIQEDNLQLPASFPTIMSTWTNQRGFPFITVERDYSSTTVTISQERYLSNPTLAPDETWWIPYNFGISSSVDFNDTTATNWFPANTRSQSIAVDGLDNTDWLIVNKRETGYYRVKYDTRNYGLIADALFKGSTSQIHAVSRAQLLDDAFNFAQTNRLNYTIFLDLSRFLAKDIDYVPWAAATTAFTYLDKMFAGHANHYVFRDYVRKLTETMYDSIMIDDITSEPLLRKYGRSLIIKWACEMGSSHCRADTLNKLRLLGSFDDFHQNVRPEVYCGAMRTALKSDFDVVWRRLLSSADSAYRNMLMTALSCTTNADLLSAYLRTSLPVTNPYNNVTYRPDELVRVFNAVYQSGPMGLRLAVPFLTTNIKSAAMTYGDTNLVTIYKNLVQRITDHSLHHEFSSLSTAMGLLISEEVATDAENEIIRNIEWVDKNGPVIDAWLKENHIVETDAPSGAGNVAVSVFMLVGLFVVSITRAF